MADRARDHLIFLVLDAVPRWMRGRLYLWVCRRQMERWKARRARHG